jgi:hypothetical protein
MTLRVQEKYRGVDNVGKEGDVDVRHTEKRYRNKNWMKAVAWLPN